MSFSDNERAETQGGRLVAALPSAKRRSRHTRLWGVLDALLAIGILGMLLILLIQVIGRMIGASPTWTEEAARFLFMDGVFLGFAAGFRAALHPRVTYLVGRGPSWLGRASLHLTVACAIFFFGILAWKSLELVIQQMRTNETSPALVLSMWTVTLPLVLGSLLAIVGAVQSAYFDRDLRSRMLQGEVIA